MQQILRAHGGFNLNATLSCGQVFGWRRNACGRWRGVIQGAPAQVWQEGEALACESALLPESVRVFFRLDDNLTEIYATFPPDEEMQAALDAFRGMRLVRQGLWECILSFVCATNTNIPRIQKMIAALCGQYGEPLSEELHAFPKPLALASAAESDLRALGLGYRAEYVLKTARQVDSGSLDLGEICGLDYEGAHTRLQSLAGIGPKAADCVCLFSLGHLQAVPVDVWVKRMVLHRAPSLKSYRDMADFARGWLGSHAGYAQQYLFHYERTRAGRSCASA